MYRPLRCEFPTSFWDKRREETEKAIGITDGDYSEHSRIREGRDFLTMILLTFIAWTGSEA